MLSKNETSFTVVEEVVEPLKFPNVDYFPYITTISLEDHDDIDPETQTRLRYHTIAKVVRGTRKEGRDALVLDFYGPRIVWYQKYFNCSRGVCAKRALKSVQNLHQAIKTSTTKETLKAAIKPFFNNPEGESQNLITSANSYFNTLNSLTTASSFKLDITYPIDLFVLPDYRVISVEDISSTSLLHAQLLPRIVIYQLDELGKIISARLYDNSLLQSENYNTYSRAVDYYFDIIKLRDIDRVRTLFSPDAVLEDPTGIVPPRTFDSVYSNFYTLQKEFEYNRSAQRSYTKGNQVALVVDANFILPNGFKLTAYPVQIFTLNEKLQITHFEAFFKPTVIDFTKIDKK